MNFCHCRECHFNFYVYNVFICSKCVVAVVEYAYICLSIYLTIYVRITVCVIRVRNICFFKKKIYHTIFLPLTA